MVRENLKWSDYLDLVRSILIAGLGRNARQLNIIRSLIKITNCEINKVYYENRPSCTGG
jgi:hypothetical protein